MDNTGEVKGVYNKNKEGLSGLKGITDYLKKFASKIKSSNNTMAAFTLFTISLISLAVVILGNISIRKNLSREKEVTEEKKTDEVDECTSLTYDSLKDFEFIDEYTVDEQSEEDRIMLSFGDADYFKERFSIDGDIVEIVYAPNRQQVIYLTGKDFYEYPDHSREVHVFDIKDNADDVVYTYQTKYKKTDQPVMALDLDILRSISLSPDETQLEIITDKEILRYSLNSKDFTFSHDGKTDDNAIRDVKNNRHFFSSSLISPDNKYSVLFHTHYEGVSYYLLNISEKTITFLDKGGYGIGTYVEGWLDTKLVYIDTQNTPAALCLENIDRSNTRCVEMRNNRLSSRHVEVSADDVYFLSERYDEGPNRKGCNNVGEIFEFLPWFDSLSKFSFDSLSSTELLHKDTTQVSGFIFNSEILNFVPLELDGDPVIVVKLKDEGENIIYAYLDPEVPEKLTKLVFN